MANTLTATAGNSSQPLFDLSIGDKITFTSTGAGSLQMVSSIRELNAGTASWVTALTASGTVWANTNGSAFRVVCTSGTCTATQDDGDVTSWALAKTNNTALFTLGSDTLTSAQAAALNASGITVATTGVIPRRTMPVAGVHPRLLKGGLNWHAFTDHTAYTASGAEAAAYTLSTVSGYNGIAYDSSGSKTGSTAMTKLSVSGAQAGVANYLITSATNLNVTSVDGKFGFWMYYSPDSTWMTPSLNIGISDVNSFPGSTDYDFSVTSNQIRQGWNFIVVSTVASSHPYGIIKTSGTADFTVSQVKQFRIYLIVPNTKTAIFYFDTAWSNFSQLPAVVIGFDGTGTSDVSNYWTPISREYGYKFYCALSAQSTGGHERVQNYSGYVTGSAAQITAMDEFHAAGNDVINHTLNHTNTSDTSRAQSITDGQLTYQLKAQTAWQLAFGWDRGKELYAAPQGRWDWASMQKMKGWGYTFQRQGSQSVNLHLTPFGYSQNENIGWFSLDAPVSGTACSDNWIAITQTMLGYGADIVWGGHQIIADSGTVTGTTVTGNSLQIYNTSIRTFLTWLKAQEAAGNLVVISMTEMAYGLR